MNANTRANELKHKLFTLVNEFKDLAIAIWNVKAGESDSLLEACLEAHGQADRTACDLAAIYERTTHELDLFFDASRDGKDQAFAFKI